MSEATPRRIATNEELRRVGQEGVGYVFNHPYRALHWAGCDHLEAMTIGQAKTFYADLDELRDAIGAEFNPCPTAGLCRLRGLRPPPPVPRPRTPRPARQPRGGVSHLLPAPSSRDRTRSEAFTCGSTPAFRSRGSTRINCESREGEVLHASYAGPRHPGSDVENILLYYVDMDGGCFRRCASRGVRFEVAPAAPREPPSGAELNCAYAYRLAPVDRGFAHWQARRDLARFDDVSVDSMTGTLLGRTWMAMHCAGASVASQPVPASRRFAVQLAVSGSEADSPVRAW